MSDPFPHSPTLENLEGSTALTTVDVALEPVGGEAVRLVEAAVSAKPPRSGRKSRALLPVNSPSASIRTPEAHLVESERPPVEEAPPVLDHTAAPVEVEQPILAQAATLESEPAFGGVAPHADPDGLPDSDAEPVEDIIEPVVTRGVPADAPSDAMLHPDVPAMADRADEPDPMVAIASKMAETFRSNLDASVVFWMAMLTVTSPSEAIDLNAAHVRDQMGRFAEAYKDFSVLARKAVTASISSIVPHRQ